MARFSETHLNCRGLLEVEPKTGCDEGGVLFTPAPASLTFSHSAPPACFVISSLHQNGVCHSFSGRCPFDFSTYFIHLPRIVQAQT